MLNKVIFETFIIVQPQPNTISSIGRTPQKNKAIIIFPTFADFLLLKYFYINKILKEIFIYRNKLLKENIYFDFC